MKITADALIVAAGRGERAGLDIPKQFYEKDGKPVLFYTIEAFRKCGIIENIVAVLPDDGFERYADYMRKFTYGMNVVYISGGSRFFDLIGGSLHLVQQPGIERTCFPIPHRLHRLFSRGDPGKNFVFIDMYRIIFHRHFAVSLLKSQQIIWSVC